MTEDPVERTAERIEHDGDEGAEAAHALLALNAQPIIARHADAVAAYIDRLEQQVDQLGAMWAQESGASPQ